MLPANRNDSCGTTPSWLRKRVQRDVADVVAVDEHLAVERVVEAGEQLGDRRLPRAGGADQRERLALGDREVDVLEHERVGCVTERDVLERDLALDRRERHRASGFSRTDGLVVKRSRSLSTPARPCWYVL